MKLFKCTVCNYIYDEGDTPPDTCPRCGASKEKFEELNEDQLKLIERSRFTNKLHQHLFHELDEICDITKKGMEDNLDPGCFAIFKKAHEDAHRLKQFIKAEIQVHIGKGKWG